MTSYRLKQYCNQTASYKAKTTPDRYGNVTYLTAVTIACRIEYGSKMVRNTTGENVVSTATVYATQQINPLDKINDIEVINVASMVNREGEIIGYEAFL